MFTTDLALRYDPTYGPISKQFHDRPNEFHDAFKRAWYKLCHRDMGPKTRHLGPWVPKEDLIWLDPIPAVDHDLIDENDVQNLKMEILDLIQREEVSISDLVKTAWGSASTYRFTDRRGGANGGRVRLDPQRNWVVNDPTSLNKVIAALETIRKRFNALQKRNNSGKQVSFADLVMLAGNAAIEAAAQRGGYGNIKVPFVPGRMDALQSETDVESFNALQPSMDGFRNYEGDIGASSADAGNLLESALINRAHLLTLTAPEMVVLVGGLRVLGANSDNSNVGVLTVTPGALTNDFFVILLDTNVVWNPSADGKFQGVDSRDSSKSWVASRVDLIMGSNSQLRVISEAYACIDLAEYFLKDFINAWTKVMMLDRFDLLHGAQSWQCGR